MIKLEVVDSPSDILYFHTMEDAEKYLAVFKDHWCNVPWYPPEIVLDDIDILKEHKEYMDMDPKKRAEEDLSWGFSLVRSRGIEDTAEQKAFVAMMVAGLSQNN